MSSNKKRAVFFDRDGTLSEEVGYVNHLTRFNLLPFTYEAIRLVNESGYLAVITTNQSGLARGYFPEELLEKIHKKMEENLNKNGAFLDGIYFCPHHELGEIDKYRKICECRKPKPGMLLKAAKDLDIDLTESYVIGDKYIDVELGHNVGAKSILVMTGYGIGEYTYQQHLWKAIPHHIAENVLEAVKIILKTHNNIKA
jgi:D-glycero-D-manno-heptose 1,7-bisphosphate phosphatase